MIATTWIAWDKPVAGPEPVYISTGLLNGNIGETGRAGTESAAIREAIDAGLARSPAGTTAEIGKDTITIRFAGTKKTRRFAIERDDDRVTIVDEHRRTLATIDRVEPIPVYAPAKEIDRWLLRERPFTALQEAVLDYARAVLPAAMLVVVEDVAAGKLDPDRDDAAIRKALGIRYRVHALEYNDDTDNPEVTDLTPIAIREDAHRAETLTAAWLPYSGYRTAYGIRSVDVAYRDRIVAICDACKSALETT